MAAGLLSHASHRGDALLTFLLSLLVEATGTSTCTRLLSCGLAGAAKGASFGFVAGTVMSAVAAKADAVGGGRAAKTIY